MLLISLDEQGDFENLNTDKGNNKAPMFIGGIIYDDKDISADLNDEKKRIYFYLKAVCTEVGAAYPRDLHVGDNHNYAKVRLVKQKITETLAEFLSTGKCVLEGNEWSERLCKMRKRDGKYHIFSLVKYGTDRKELQSENTSILIREDYASNLYVHMAEDIIERIIFHNPIIENVGKVRLNLATRRAVLEKGELGDGFEEKAKQYISLGYKEDLEPEHQKKGQRTFILTNGDIYRTAIEREMFDTGKRNIQVESVGVKSIYYGSETDNYRMEFLYLADIICTVLGFEPDTSSVEAMISDMRSRADKYAGHSENLIFAYDAVDTVFKKAWHKLEEKEYFEVLRFSYAGLQKKSPYNEFYKNVWFRILEEHLLKEKNVPAYGIALRKFYLLTKENNIDQRELVYIFEMLEAMLKQMHLKGDDQNAFLYELYDAGISAYTHIGDSIQAKECFEKCKEYAKYVEIERFLRTRNKLAVFLSDMLLVDEAAAIAQENIVYQEELLSIRELVFDKDEVSKGYGRALSQLGQSLASARIEEAEATFLKALEQISDETSQDYYQTESYLLHFYIEMGMKEKYTARCERYFGGEKGLRGQFKAIRKEAAKGEAARFSTKFALYFYVKGLYRFHMEKISPELLGSLYGIEKEIRDVCKENADRILKGHPWELIYKYIALIALKKGNVKKADEFMVKIPSALTYREFILNAICLSGEMEYAVEKEENSWKNRLEELLELLREHAGEVYEKVAGLNTAEEQYAYIKEKVLNFMYD